MPTRNSLRGEGSSGTRKHTQRRRGFGLLFISDADARPAGERTTARQPLGNATTPSRCFITRWKWRRIGLAQFGLGNIERGTPLSLLEAKLLPLYLHHRYQLQAAAKSLGGVYTYAVKTSCGCDAARVTKSFPAARATEALRAVLDTIKLTNSSSRRASSG